MTTYSYRYTCMRMYVRTALFGERRGLLSPRREVCYYFNLRRWPRQNGTAKVDGGFARNWIGRAVVMG